MVKTARRVSRKVVFRLMELYARRTSPSTETDPFHELSRRFFREAAELRPCRILELGSRVLPNGLGSKKACFARYDEYVGFDIHPGDEVDVVGDIHQLSTHLPAEHFTAVFSVSVFEHLAMPWKAVLEINRVMAVGGLMMIQTHPAWPAHELPWDFWRYQQSSFKALLNRFTGFEIVACSEGLPCRILPLGAEGSMRGLMNQPASLGITVLARKISPPSDCVRWDVATSEITDDLYPRG